MPEGQVLKTRRKALKDIYIALVTKNSAIEYATETPTKLGRSISAKVTFKKNVDKTRSDDSVEEVIESDEGIEIEFDVNKLSPEQKAILRGATYKNGMLVYNKDDQAKEVAIGWRARNTNGKYEFVWYYCGKFNGGWSEDYETEQDKIKTQTAKMKGTFYSREKDGNSCVEVDESYLLEEHNSAKTAIEAWFTKVPEPLVS
ncbi:TPA: phage tail protein [Clostridium perfringens]|uniref:Major tail protein n=2 Tax=Clostridium perfringens TaxID=1502 RepID=A0A2X2XWK8_CLOPF|nr:major tail protein [Clostridium perfringens]MDM1010776.1 phage tail protein [Clostridium perfringens]MDU4070369.1 phage tail protein [Clostridium perfringens]SQB57828.1 major tail protein [Clostridium perfringens]HAT4145517.1 phage tail protein [Clostridium perfringens]